MANAMRFAVALILASALAGAARADVKGTAILKQAFSTLHAAKTFRAKVTHTETERRLSREQTGVVLTMKPNLMRFELTGRMAPTFVSDGKTYYMYAKGGQIYRKMPVKPNQGEFFGLWEGEVDSFFGGATLVGKVQADYVGPTRHAGKDCDVVRVTMKEPDRTAVYTIGRADHLIYKSVMTIAEGGRSRTQTNVLSEIKINGPMKASEFRAAPGPGMQEAPSRPAPPSDRIGL